MNSKSPNDSDRAYKLRNALEAYRASNGRDPDRVTYVLVDCPPSLNLLTINALAAADAVVVPLQCEFFALEGLSQLLTTVEQVRRALNPTSTIHGVVLTMYNSRNSLAGQVVADVRAHLGDKVYETVIPRNVRISEAPSHGKPALLYDLKCAGSQAYLSSHQKSFNAKGDGAPPESAQPNRRSIEKSWRKTLLVPIGLVWGAASPPCSAPRTAKPPSLRVAPEAPIEFLRPNPRNIRKH